MSNNNNICLALFLIKLQSALQGKEHTKQTINEKANKNKQWNHKNKDRISYIHNNNPVHLCGNYTANTWMSLHNSVRLINISIKKRGIKPKLTEKSQISMWRLNLIRTLMLRSESHQYYLLYTLPAVPAFSFNIGASLPPCVQIEILQPYFLLLSTSTNSHVKFPPKKSPSLAELFRIYTSWSSPLVSMALMEFFMKLKPTSSSWASTAGERKKSNLGKLCTHKT